MVTNTMLLQLATLLVSKGVMSAAEVAAMALAEANTFDATPHSVAADYARRMASVFQELDRG